MIAIPVWGEHHFQLLERIVLPAIDVAVRAAEIGVVYMVHTNDAERVKRIFSRLQVIVRPVATDFSLVIKSKSERYSKYYSMSDAHREVINSAIPGQRVALINADMVPSIEVFRAAEHRFSAGKKMIVMASTRTMAPEPPPIGVRSSTLLEWVWQNRHPWITDCLWASGRASTCLSGIHFTDGANVVTRAFHLHPFAFVKPEQKTDFAGLTIDFGLFDNFAFEDIHVVTDPDEAAFAEMSLANQRFKHMERNLTVKDVAFWARGPLKPQDGASGYRASPTHMRLFEKRIVLRGQAVPELGDVEVCNEILRLVRQ